MGLIFNEDGSTINTNQLEFLSDKGSQFKVYKYENSVIKLYRRKPNVLADKKFHTLMNIPTRRILLPTGILFDNNHELCGYKMPLIVGEKEVGIDKLKLFLNELEVLKRDLELLCNNHVTLRDITCFNTIYNGRIYLIDPGNYSINEINTTIFRTNIKDPVLAERINYLIENKEYGKAVKMIKSLSDEEKKEVLKSWNYEKINRLIELLIFSKQNLDQYKYLQITQFFTKERKEKKLIYNLDVLKMHFNEDLTIDDAVNDFVKRKIKNKFRRKKTI